MIRFVCPRCGMRLKVGEAYAGRAARCTRCREPLTVPLADESPDFEVVDGDEPQPAARTDKKTRQAVESAPPPRSAPRASERATRGRAAETTPPAPPQDEDAESVREARPKKKKRKKTKQDDGIPLGVVVGVGGGLAFLWLALSGAGIFFRPVALVMLALGAALFILGRKWILSMAAEEGTGQYLACLLVPFYDTWFTYSRLRQTWTPCLVCWAGRGFTITAGIILIVHLLRGGLDDHEFGRPADPKARAVQSDEEAAKLLAKPNTAEAKAWLEEPNKRRGIFKKNKQAMLDLVNQLYAKGAMKVTAVDIDEAFGMELSEQLIVTLPDDAPKRQGIIAFINDTLGEDDERRSDHGQKYEILTMD